MFTSRLKKRLHSILRQKSIAGEEGLTLLECIVAILVIGIAGATIAPALVLSVATRIQNQRAEQALELAQSEIDRVRVLVERDGNTAIAALPPATSAATASAVPAPDGTLNEPPAAVTDAFPVDIDGDGDDDFAVQSFRTEGLVPTNVAAFEMGVRVYDIRAFDNLATLVADNEASLGLTSDEGQRTTRPLAILYTQIVASEDATAYCNYIEYTRQFIEPGDPAPRGC